MTAEPRKEGWTVDNELSRALAAFAREPDSLMLGYRVGLIVLRTQRGDDGKETHICEMRNCGKVFVRERDSKKPERYCSKACKAEIRRLATLRQRGRREIRRRRR